MIPSVCFVMLATTKFGISPPKNARPTTVTRHTAGERGEIVRHEKNSPRTEFVRVAKALRVLSTEAVRSGWSLRRGGRGGGGG
jgi:hypothetical protein